MKSSHDRMPSTTHIMPTTVRNWFPFVALVVLFSALAWAVSFGTLPTADFSFHNGDEVKTVDPAKATGQPEHRVITSLFQGLYQEWPSGYELDEDGSIVSYPTPDANGNYAMEAAPGMAESCDISDDGRTYTFRIRSGAKWSDGSPFTAHDFVWSWRRTLHPETASQYAYQLWYLTGAQQYTEARTRLGDQVEVELPNRPRPDQPFPRGDMVRGRLVGIARPAQPTRVANATEEATADAEAAWKKRWVYLIEANTSSSPSATVSDPSGESQDAPAAVAMMAFTHAASEDRWQQFDIEWLESRPRAPLPANVAICQQILLDFDSSVGVRAEDEQTLVVTLNNRTPFFLHLTAFYPLFPVNRRCVETFGTPDWTKPENLVCNGPYTLQFRRVRDRLRLVKNPHYWGASGVQLEVVDAMSFKSETTALNMYLTGQLDWITDVPSSIIPDLMAREEQDYNPTPLLIIYFYRVNVTRAPCDDVHVRRALNMAIDKQLICDKVAQAGQVPARSLVPPGLPGYTSPLCGEFNVEAARAELAKSRYAGRAGGFPPVEILYNTNENHRAIAEVIQQQWKNNLGIDVVLKNSEWTTYLDAIHSQQYSIARAGWVPDYPDANTFIDMWVTGGENNETGWSNTRYDDLVKQAASATDADERLRMLEAAEAILMDELPVIPIYFYVSKQMISPRIKGFFPNIQDQHPLHLIRIED